MLTGNEVEDSNCVDAIFPYFYIKLMIISTKFGMLVSSDVRFEPFNYEFGANI